MNVTAPNFGQQRSSRASGHLYFLPSCCGSRPSLTEGSANPPRRYISPWEHVPPSHLPPPTTAACLRFGLPRCKEQKERPEHDGGKISRACIAGIGGLNWARVVPLPVIFPPAPAPEQQHQSTSTRALAPTLEHQHQHLEATSMGIVQ